MKKPEDMNMAMILSVIVAIVIGILVLAVLFEPKTQPTRQGAMPTDSLTVKQDLTIVNAGADTLAIRVNSPQGTPLLLPPNQMWSFYKQMVPQIQYIIIGRNMEAKVTRPGGVK